MMSTGHNIRPVFVAVILFASGATAAPEDAPARPEADARLGPILDQWQHRSAAHTSLEVSFTGLDHSQDWGDEPFAGRVVLLPGGRALVEIVSHLGKPNAAMTERLIWTEDSFHHLWMERKEHFVWPIARMNRGRLPAVLALPFLWRVDAEGLRSRYQVAVAKEEAETLVLRFAPLPKSGTPSFSKSYLQLDRATSLPRRYFVVSRNGKSTKDYRVTETRSDKAIPEDVLRLPDDDGWKVIRMDEKEPMRWLIGSIMQDLLP